MSKMKSSAKSCIPRLKSPSVSIEQKNPSECSGLSSAFSTTRRTSGTTRPLTDDDIQQILSGNFFPNLDASAACESDRGSIKSFCSNLSTRSYQGTQPTKKYVLHCQRHPVTDSTYLTPTQRKDRQIKQLKLLLTKTAKLCNDKESEIQKLRCEVEYLRTFVKKSNFGDFFDPPSLEVEPEFSGAEPEPAIDTVDTSVTPTSMVETVEDSGILTDESNKDSTSTSASKLLDDKVAKNVSSPKSLNFPEPTQNEELFFNHYPLQNVYEDREVGFHNDVITCEWELVVEELKKNHNLAYQELKKKYNDRIENLLQKLTEATERYYQLRPSYEESLNKIQNLELVIADLRKEVSNQEDWHRQMYLKMYRKGQEAAKFEHADEVLEFAHQAPKRVSVPELISQVHRLEHELANSERKYHYRILGDSGQKSDLHPAEYTLKFLKDAVYYFLTEKDNKEHLKAIESILEYNEMQKLAINRALRQRKL